VKKFIAAGCMLWPMLSWYSTCHAIFNDLFATSDECAFCHTSSASALVDSNGNDLSIGDDWSSSMMANSFKDPLFRAKLESEVARTPHLASLIEDKCVTCHAPMARTQAIMDGARHYSLSAAEASEFAWDGVSCALCHQIQDDKLGEEQSFSGGYVINHDRKIFGPYRQVFPNPMLNHTGYLPVYGEQVDKPEFCATCHTLFTPYIDDNGNVAGEFPEQTPYLEWLNSSYASADNYLSCQDCHMPVVDDPVKITNRPPWYQVKHSPFWKHHFIGGNRFILAMMKKNREELGIIPAESRLEKSIQRTEDRLQNDSADMSIDKISLDDGRLQVDVKIVNKTGHKFPTGFPSRRVWIHFAVIDAEGETIFESGNFTGKGKIVNRERAYEPHHNVIDSPGQTQIYQAVMGDLSGERTETLLKSAKYIKDNRIPPKGYGKSGPMVKFTGIAGKANSDANFNINTDGEGTGADIVSYEVDTSGAPYPLTIRGQLLYQSSNPNFIENLLEDQTPAVSRFGAMYEHADNTPVVVDSFIAENISGN